MGDPIGTLASGAARLQLRGQAGQSRRPGIGHLAQPVGHEALEHAKVGRKRRADAGDLALVPRAQHLLDRVIQQQAAAVRRAELVHQLPARPARPPRAVRRAARARRPQAPHCKLSEQRVNPCRVRKLASPSTVRVQSRAQGSGDCGLKDAPRCFEASRAASQQPGAGSAGPRQSWSRPSSQRGGPPPPRVNTPANFSGSNFCFTNSCAAHAARFGGPPAGQLLPVHRLPCAAP